MNPSTSFPSGPVPASAQRRLLRAVPLVALWAVGTLGCYRATGIQRPPALASEIPAIGGDRVHGLKAQAGPGDYFLGNDYIELAVDGSILGEREAIAGAAAGGSIVDVGYVGLDTSFHRVSIPSDPLDRMTPVVNQDPELPLVFDAFRPINEAGESRLEMSGTILDRSHKLAGASWDAQGRVAGVQVTHIVRLGKQARFFTLETTIRNSSGATLPIRNVGDLVVQLGGGLRFLVPATQDLNGASASGWGVEVPSPGADWNNPIAGSVKSHLVAGIGVEPGADSLDSHLSLGLLPLDADQLVVAADPQPSLTEFRPKFAAQLVAGSLPVASLASGQELAHHRRLYVFGGTTVSGNRPNQSCGEMIFGGGGYQLNPGPVDSLEFERASLRGSDFGIVTFSTFGTATRTGPLPSEIRWERDLGGGAWQVERVDWLEPQENRQAGTSISSVMGALLPTGTYRIVIRNKDRSLAMTQFTDAFNPDRPDLKTPLVVTKQGNFVVNESLAPERNLVLNAGGTVASFLYGQHAFVARERGGLDGMYQPLRFTISGTGGSPDPNIRRIRSLAGDFDPLTKAKVVSLLAQNTGVYQFVGGNSLFGASFPRAASGTYFLPHGEYELLATRGPQSSLDRVPFSAYDGLNIVEHGVIVFPSPLPASWTSFDLPGPSQATTGGCLPAERLASALAENVQVVGATEQDLHVDADAQYNEFRLEFGTYGSTDSQRTAIHDDPFVVGGRSSTLVDQNRVSWGTASALWVPKSTADRARGALSAKGWGLADFIAQSLGKYTVVHRPRGPQGLFTLRAFDPAVALGTGANLWWAQTGQLSLGATQGGFDALELLRAESFDPAAPDAWFAEYKAVRRDWFALLNQQRPGSFTKALGLSAARFSLDTPVGLARTYLNIGTAALSQSNLDPVLAALKSGAAVASTGPLLDVSIAGSGPGGLVSASGTASLSIGLYAPDWMPVDEVRIVVNGQVVQTLDPSTFGLGGDWRQRTATVAVPLPSRDCWIVVEAGVPLATAGAYRAGTPWNRIQKGIYPIAVSNPIFIDVNGGGYTPPGL